mgnify:CR=1 FL=1
MIDRDGQFTWDELRVFDGIRQDVSESIRKYRLVRNAHFANRGALTKDLGFKPLHASRIGSAAKNVTGLLDCHFNNATQILVAVNEGGSNADAYTFDTATRAWTAQSVSIANGVRPMMVMFADQLHIADGGTLRRMNASKSWSTPGESTYSNPCKFGTVYANRLILSGNATYPYSFFPSGVRDSSSWDATLAVDVTGSQGERITCLGTLGTFLIVGGETFTRAYYLGTASPRDWDGDVLSSRVGPVHHSSYVEVPAAGGDASANFGFFWSREGPQMVAQIGRGLPVLTSLAEPIRRAVRGVDFEGLDGLAVESYDDVTAAYIPEYDEIRFSLIKKTNYSATARADVIYCLSLSSAIAYANNPGQAYPIWRIRDNTNQALPCSTLATARLHPDTHLPSVDGTVRGLAAQDGFVYEMDAVSQYTDNIEGTTYSIPMFVRRDNYDGIEDQVRSNTKSLRTGWFRTTMVGDYSLYTRAIVDGGRRESTSTISLNAGLNTWGDGSAWGDGDNWNASDFVNSRSGLGVLGKKFDLELYDNGNIEGDFQINSWSLLGYVEDRR